MPAAYTHPAGHEIDFPAPGLFSIKMSDGRQSDVPLHVEIPSHEHRLYGALIMSTLGIPVPPEDLRTPDGGMMIWSERLRWRDLVQRTAEDLGRRSGVFPWQL